MDKYLAIIAANVGQNSTEPAALVYVPGGFYVDQYFAVATEEAK